MLGEEFLRFLPHLFGEDVSCVRFDESGEIFRDTGFLIGLGDCIDTLAGFLDGGTSVVFAQVQVQGAGSDEAGYVRGVPMGMDTGNEVGEAVQELDTVDAFVGR